MQSLTIAKPNDMHVHFRDGAMLRAVVPFTARAFGHAIVMPNLTPPVTSAAMASAYRSRILAAVPPDAAFTPLMTCYLTDDTDAGRSRRRPSRRHFHRGETLSGPCDDQRRRMA